MTGLGEGMLEIECREGADGLCLTRTSGNMQGSFGALFPGY